MDACATLTQLQLTFAAKLIGIDHVPAAARLNEDLNLTGDRRSAVIAAVRERFKVILVDRDFDPGKRLSDLVQVILTR